MTTTQAGDIINQAGLIPAIKGMTTTNPVNQQMLDFATKGGMTVYPMIDNVIQSEVVNVGNKELPSVLNGTISPQSALQAMQNALAEAAGESQDEHLPVVPDSPAIQMKRDPVRQPSEGGVAPGRRLPPAMR